MNEETELETSYHLRNLYHDKLNVILPLQGKGKSKFLRFDMSVWYPSVCIQPKITFPSTRHALEQSHLL